MSTRTSSQPDAGVGAPPKLLLRGVRRRFPNADTVAVDGVDLAVRDGEVLVLVGPSGCGKSTVLRLIAGLEAPDAGEIHLDGKNLARVPPQERDVAMVFQGYALYPHMTVAENIAFPLKMRGVPRARREARTREVAGVLSIGALLDRLPGELSGGERQRVAMGRALVREPKLFLFDEPLSNLDAALRTALRVEIAQTLRRLGATAIYVTHDQVEAMTIGHRVAVMRGGRVLQVAPARAIYEHPESAFVAGFLGTPQINLWRAVMRSGRAELAEALTVSPPDGLKATGGVILGARPERVQIRGADDAAPEAGLTFVAEVVATEPLGSETVVHAEGPIGAAEKLSVRAKVPGFFDPSLCDRVRVHVAPADLSWFDAETDARLAGTST